MPDIGWMELLVVGIVALIVMGPRDFPMLFRKLGQATGKVRAMARDFQRAMDEAADETGMTEINRDLRKAAQFTTNPAKAGRDAVKEAFGDLDPTKFDEGSETKAMAEAKVAKQAAIREKAQAAREARAAKLSNIDEAADDMAAEAMGATRDVESVLKPASASAAPKAKPKTKPKAKSKAASKPAAAASEPEPATAAAVDEGADGPVTGTDKT